jgi:predicted dehydrogenase
MSDVSDAVSKARVAVAGARGIGKHHARWWELEGAEVCAFAGASPDSLASTRQALTDFFGFSGRAYSSLPEMIEREHPGIVDICSPPMCHYDHVRTALEAGCHVLCEKPFVYDPALDRAAILERAQALVDLANGRGLRLCVCTQYSAGARDFARIWKQCRNGENITHYHGHLEAPAKNRPPDPERVWVDLSPHLLSVLLNLAPEGEVVWDSLRTTFQGYEASAEFEVRRGAAPPLQAFCVTRNATQPPFNVRHFKYNGYPFAVEGENDGQGVYSARIETPDGNYREPDMMRALIRDFLAGTPTTTMQESVTNLDLMLRIRDAARRQREKGSA